MTFGFPAYHQEEVAFPFPITHEWVVAAGRAEGFAQVQSAPEIKGWRVVRLKTPLSWGETMTMTLIAPNTLRVRSQCSTTTQCFDWGANQENVERFIQRMWLAIHLQPPPFVPSR